MVLKNILAVLFILFGYDSLAQNSKENPVEPAGPYYPAEKAFSAKQRKIDASKTTVDLQREYYQRVDAVMKARKKAAREMRKPQYSNPMYFGHKRMPKKHSPKKMRHCHQCGIRH